MKFGCKRIIAKTSEGDEYALYRINPEKKHYFMISFSTYKETIRHGKAIAKQLSVPFESWLVEPDHEEDENAESDTIAKSDTVVSKDPHARPTKPRRVAGAVDGIRTMVANGEPDRAILAKWQPKYVEAGRPESEAREYVLYYIKQAKSGKS